MGSKQHRIALQSAWSWAKKYSIYPSSVQTPITTANSTTVCAQAPFLQIELENRFFWQFQIPQFSRLNQYDGSLIRRTAFDWYFSRVDLITSHKLHTIIGHCVRSMMKRLSPIVQVTDTPSNITASTKTGLAAVSAAGCGTYGQLLAVQGSQHRTVGAIDPGHFRGNNVEKQLLPLKLTVCKGHSGLNKSPFRAFQVVGGTPECSYQRRPYLSVAFILRECPPYPPRRRHLVQP